MQVLDAVGNPCQSTHENQGCAECCVYKQAGSTLQTDDKGFMPTTMQGSHTLLGLLLARAWQL